MFWNLSIIYVIYEGGTVRREEDIWYYPILNKILLEIKQLQGKYKK